MVPLVEDATGQIIRKKPIIVGWSGSPSIATQGTEWWMGFWVSWLRVYGTPTRGSDRFLQLRNLGTTSVHLKMRKNGFLVPKRHQAKHLGF
jgi:hypothetical protein